MAAIAEEWRPVEGYEGIYNVSNLGRVYSVPRRSANGNPVGGYCLKQKQFRNGYLFTHLTKEGITKQFLIHRLVASAFLPKQEGRPEVNHIDGNKHNNNAENLEWCNRSENNLHAIRTGLRDLTAAHETARIANMRPVALFLDGEKIATFRSIKDAAYVIRKSNGAVRQCIVNGGWCGEYEIRYEE